MAFRRKHSRPISVDGIDYRWRLGRASRSEITTPLFVWTNSTDGTRLFATISGVWDDQLPEWLPMGRGTPVTPSFVADVIREAIRIGWRPKTAGSVVRIEVDPPGRAWLPGEFEQHLESWNRKMRERPKSDA